jgi:hypothetical protein
MMIHVGAGLAPTLIKAENLLGGGKPSPYAKPVTFDYKYQYYNAIT